MFIDAVYAALLIDCRYIIAVSAMLMSLLDYATRRCFPRYDAAFAAAPMLPRLPLVELPPTPRLIDYATPDADAIRRIFA